MAPRYVPVVLLLAAVFSMGRCASKEVAPPMVAFVCNKPAMYLTETGWVRDETTDCLKKPTDILNYCKEVYPDMDITNVVEATAEVDIDNWCSYEREHCKHHGTHKVRPFRCLMGPFQSDALLVPEHCIFDHIHDAKQCKAFSAWNETAALSCDKRGMDLQSFAILLPCGIDVFSGVEFVCCPGHGANAVQIVEPVQLQPKQRKPDYIDYADEAPPPAADKEKVLDDQFFADLKPEEEDKSAALVANDAYDEYMKNPVNDYYSEHDYFNRAKGELQKHHHESVTKMMKEWAAARQRVQEMKATDPKAAERLNKEVTARFQKTYQALEQEEMVEKDQLNAVHQQRIQSELNDKKRTAMEHYMDSLVGDAPEASKVLKSLQHYIKSEEKDRMHSVNHYKHLLDTSPVEADRVREQTLEHLRIIQERITQAIEMLNRVPRIQDKVKEQIEGWLRNFHDIDDNIADLFTKPAVQATAPRP